MSDLVKIQGNCGNKPELRYTQTAKPVCNFSIYENQFTSVDGKITKSVKRTRVTCWDDLAQSASEALDKGSRCTVEGILRPHQWTDKSGQVHDEIELVARNIENS